MNNLSEIKIMLNFPSPFMIFKDQKDLKEKFTNKEADGSIDAEDLLNFSFILPSPRTWYEEGIAYRILKNLTSPIHSIYFRMDKAKEKNGNMYSRKVEVVSYSESGKVKEYECDEKDDISDGKEAEIIKALFGQCLDFFDNPEKTKKFKDSSKDYHGHDALVFPIYEVYIDNEGYGGIWGFCSIFYKKTEELGNILETVEKEMSTCLNLTAVANLLFESGLQIIDKELDNHIQNPDSSGGRINILNQFISMLINVQDWENIWIVREIKKTKSVDSKRPYGKWGEDKRKRKIFDVFLLEKAL